MEFYTTCGARGKPPLGENPGPVVSANTNSQLGASKIISFFPQTGIVDFRGKPGSFIQ